MKKITTWIFAALCAVCLTACGVQEQSGVPAVPEQNPPQSETTDISTETQSEEETTVETKETTVQPEAVLESRLPKAKQAKTVYLVQEPSAFYEKVTLGAMQGLLAKHSEEQLLVMTGDVKAYIPYIEDNWNCPVEKMIDGAHANIYKIAEKFTDVFKGYILCSMNEDDPSVNVAISLSGLLDAFPATKANAKKFEDMGYTCLLDATDKDDAWLRASEYWDSLSRDIAMEQKAGNAPKLVDYAVMTNAYFNFYEGHSSKAHKEMYGFLNDNAVVFGYNNTLGEFDTVKSFGEININMVPSDYAANLSTLSGFRMDSIKQKRAAAEETAEPKNVHTVCFLMSDGDNMQWILNNFLENKSYFGSDLRGSFPVAWGIPPTSVELIPPMMTAMYDKMTEKDEFVMELSGLGYTFPSKWEKEARQEMTADLADYMKRSDLQYAEILDDNGFRADVLEDFTAQEGIDGLFYIEYSHYAGMRGKMIWTNGKPAVSARYRLWADMDDSSIESISTRINRAPTDPTNEKSYSLISVHAWSGLSGDGKLVGGGNTMDALAALMQEFDEDVEVVTPSEFMRRINANLAEDNQ